MMKKALRAAAALLALSVCLVSCKESPKPEEEIVGDVEMVEYTSGEAKEIRIPLTYSEDPAPFEVMEYDIPDLGRKKPKCCTDSDNRLHPDEYYEQPCFGRTVDYTISGDYIYLAVDYDDYCHNGHETAIVSYNTQTSELKELYVHSDAERGEDIMALTAVGDKLYASVNVTYVESPEYNRYIYEIDMETGEKKTIYEDQSVYITELNELDGKLYYCYNEYITETDEMNFILKSYTPETGEWTDEKEVLTSDVNDDMFYGNISYHASPFCFGEVLCSTEKGEDSNSTKFVADKYFSLETKHKMIQLAGADENRVRWLNESNYGTYTELYLNSFNRETMEISSVKLNRQNAKIVSVGEGCFVILGSDDSTVNYLLPELGLAFPLTEQGDYSDLKQENGIVSFVEYSNADYVLDAENAIIMGSVVCDRIYMIDTKPQAE